MIIHLLFKDLAEKINSLICGAAKAGNQVVFLQSSKAHNGRGLGWTDRSTKHWHSQGCCTVSFLFEKENLFILLKDNYNIFLTMCLFYITVKKQFLESLFIEQRDWHNVFFLECETDKNNKILKKHII